MSEKPKLELVVVNIHHFENYTLTFNHSRYLKDQGGISVFPISTLKEPLDDNHDSTTVPKYDCNFEDLTDNAKKTWKCHGLKKFSGSLFVVDECNFIQVNTWRQISSISISKPGQPKEEAGYVVLYLDPRSQNDTIISTHEGDELSSDQA